MASNHSSSNRRSRSYSSSHLSDMNEVKKVFDRFDKNGDGKISGEELAGVMSALGSEPSQEEVTRMMEEMDSDRDGFVSLDEFAEFCARKVDGDESGVRELRDAFGMYDQDNNGLISANELHLVLSRLGELCSVEDCSRMIQSVDSDGDGNVNFDEFRKMMTNSKPSSF
ncbi:hypothetical protein Cgig2_004726 [Carnegiea gigantea]|uniref:EF-hand domain-containing protein n=1 Tax=Carnegiea gigantea TaxID=171969 RepID=A0A9Q1QQC2_9CARY|nr:hypothetical protein Cgig2_004726 [Carnegiea gigantea]